MQLALHLSLSLSEAAYENTGSRVFADLVHTHMNTVPGYEATEAFLFAKSSFQVKFNCFVYQTPG